MKPAAASLPGPTPRPMLPQRADAVAPVLRRLPFQVLQSGRAPAQLSLFQRPAFGAR